MTVYKPGDHFTLNDGTPVRVVAIPDVPAKWWAKYDKAWTVSVFNSEEWEFNDFPPERVELISAGGGRRDGMMNHYAVVIPDEYFEPATNEWGEVHP